ncbi:MAG TPA: hypothetical protein VH682_11975 [Gemmataceae bacterium]|jgi:hypothetical protein
MAIFRPSLERLEDRLVPAGLNLPSGQQLFSEGVAVLQNILTVQAQAGIPITSDQFNQDVQTAQAFVILSHLFGGQQGQPGLAVPQGPTGPQGPQGPQGSQGPAAPTTLVQTVFADLRADVSTSSTAFTNIPGLTATLTTKAGDKLIIQYDASFEADTGPGSAAFRITIDGIPVPGSQSGSAPGAGLLNNVAAITEVPITAGSHTVAVQWVSLFGFPLNIKAATGADTQGYGASLLVQEVSA